MAYSIDILNKIRAEASQEYQNRIPEATRENIAAIGTAFRTYKLLYNEFCDALVNRIGLTLFETATFENKLKAFKLGEITSGQDVQEIFTHLAKAEGKYDPQGANPLGRRAPAPVDVVYHRLNRQDKYVMSIGDLDFRRNFTSPEALDIFISGQLNSIYMADEYDEWILFKQLLGSFSFENKDGETRSYFNYECPAFTGANNGEAAKGFIKTLKKAVQDMSFMSDKYNAAGVMRRTSPDNYALLINKDLLPEISVEVLMSAFNAAQADIKPTIITMDDFGELTTGADGSTTLGLLIEKDFPRIWDTLIDSEQIRNPDGLFTNTFYHHHQILSLSPFKNAVRLHEKVA